MGRKKEIKQTVYTKQKHGVMPCFYVSALSGSGRTYAGPYIPRSNRPVKIRTTGAEESFFKSTGIVLIYTIYIYI